MKLVGRSGVRCGHQLSHLSFDRSHEPRLQSVERSSVGGTLRRWATQQGPEQADQSTPCWLTADEQATWLALGALVTRLPAAVDADLQASSGVSLFEYLVLAHLSEAPGRTLRMSDLGSRG